MVFICENAYCLVGISATNTSPFIFVVEVAYRIPRNINLFAHYFLYKSSHFHLNKITISTNPIFLSLKSYVRLNDVNPVPLHPFNISNRTVL